MNRENLIYNLWYRQPDWYSWSKAFLLSLFLHLGILLIAITFSSISPRTAALPMVYNVELVGAVESSGPPQVTRAKSKGKTAAKRSTTKSPARNALKSIPIWRVKPKTAPAIATPIEKARPTVPQTKTEDSSNLVGKELEKLAKLTAANNRAKAQKSSQAAGKAEKAEKQAKGSTQGISGRGGWGAGVAASGEALSLARSAYYTEVWDRIRREWAFPRELATKKGNLSATIVIKIRRDGKILDAKFEKRSGDKVFDESVWRAIWKADPLPPFPQIYSAQVDELGIRFRLAELLR